MTPRPHYLRGFNFPGSRRVTERVIRTRLNPLQRLWRLVRIAWLRWQISTTEQWLAQLQRDGIINSLSVREFHKQVEAMRVELAIVEQS
jgi:hypothetical protein